MRTNGLTVVLCAFLLVCVFGALHAQVSCEAYNFGPRNINAMLRSGDLLYLATENGLMVVNTTDNSMQHYHLGNSTFKAQQAYCLAKKSNGSIWIGTDNGLFKIVNGVLSRYMASYLGGAVTSLHVDANNIIWLVEGAGANYDLYKINQSETLVPITLSGSTPNAICSDNTGAMWVGSRYDLKKWRPDTGETTTYTTTNSALPDNEIRAIKRDAQGNMWVLSALGLTRISPEGIWTVFGGAYEHPLAGALQIDIDALNRVWIVKSNMLLSFDSQNITTYTDTVLGVNGYPLKSVLCAEGTLYYGARGHVGKSVNGGYTTQAIYNTDLPNYDIYTIQEDGRRGLWITYGYQSEYPQQYTRIPTTVPQHYPAPFVLNNVVRFVLADNMAYYALVGGAIYQCEGTQWDLVTTQDWIERCFYSQGKAYFNPSSSGIYAHDGDTGWSIPLDFPGSEYNHAARLSADQDGRLWFWNNGLVSYADSTFTVHPPSGNNSVPNCISPDRNGNVWLGYNNGSIAIYDGENYNVFPTNPYSEGVMQIIVENNEAVWIRSDRSVYVWHPQSGYQTVMHSGLSNTPLLSITDVRGDRVMIVCKTGYFVYNFTLPSAVQDDTYTPALASGFLTAYPNPSRGEVWFNTAGAKASTPLQIYNIKGQLVRELKSTEQDRQYWDGIDSSGKTVANGIYLVSACVEGTRITRKMLIRR